MPGIGRVGLCLLAIALLSSGALPASASALKIGFSDDAERLEAVPSAIRKAHVQIARFPVSWYLLEPQQGEYDFSRTDAAITALERAGVRPMISVYGAPAWAGPQVASVHCSCARAFDPDWQELWRRLAERYPSALLNVWNEPNFPFYGSLTTERAAELTNLAASAIWSVDPARRVLGPAASPGVDGWLAYTAAMYRRIDPRVELAANLYPFGRSHANFKHELSAVRAIARGREVWITETGVSRLIVSQRTQTRFIRRAYIHARQRRDVKALLFYRLWSPHEPTGGPAGTDWDAGLSALEQDGEPTAMYNQIAKLRRTAGGGAPKFDVPENAAVEALGGELAGPAQTAVGGGYSAACSTG